MDTSLDSCRRRPMGAHVALAALLALGAPGVAAAADLPAPAASAPAAPAAEASGWHYQATLYGWATAINGDVGARHLPTSSIDVPFSEVLSNLDGALMGSFFADNGQWLVLADLVLARLSHSTTLDAYGANLDVSLGEIITSGAIGYMLPIGQPGFSLAVTGGVRYMQLRTSETLSPLLTPISFSTSQTQSWTDPTVGFFAQWKPQEKWFVNLIADIGGFGVGSKLSSTGYLGVGYMWTSSFSTALGYRYLYEDYQGPSDASGSFRFRTTTHGPTVAMAWHF